MKLYERIKTFQRMKRLVYVSTGCALAESRGSDTSVVVETNSASLDLDSPYQVSKVAGEMYSLYYYRQEGLPVVRARFQNVYGPGEVLGAGQWRGTKATVWRNVVPTFVYRALKGLPLLVHGDGEGGRDFIFVDDIVEGLVRCGTAAGIEGEAFNLASGRVIKIKELAKKIIAIGEGTGRIEWVPQRDWDRSFSRCGSPVKSKEALGFAARVGIDEGLRRTVDWTRSNLVLIEECIGKHADRMDFGSKGFVG